MRRFSLVASCLLAASASAQETEITVLGVTLPNSNYNVARNYLDDIDNFGYWGNTGVTVRVANFGFPVPMSSVQIGLFVADLPIAMQTAANLGLRKDADVILFFVGDGDIAGWCGFAKQVNWTSASGDPVDARWHPGPNGLDLGGKDDSYAAIIATTGSCTTIEGTAIHEFGHLLGGGHAIDDPESPPDAYLYSDSHGARFLFYGYAFRTIITQKPTDCLPDLDLPPLGQPEPCFFWPTWSGSSSYIVWSPTQKNIRAITTTARSVANYRTALQIPVPPPPNPPLPPLDPPCTLQTPLNPVAVYVPPACNPFPDSRYNYYWDDLCPSASSHYLIEHEQPINTGIWQPTSGGPWYWPGAAIWINGPPGHLRVKACNGGGCSAPSTPVLITDQC